MNSSIAELVNEYVWYAGRDQNNDAVTMGFNDAVDTLILGMVYSDGSEDEFVAMTIDSEAGKVIDDSGNEYDFGFEVSEESPLKAVVTLNGEKIDVCGIDSDVFPEFQSE